MWRRKPDVAACLLLALLCVPPLAADEGCSVHKLMPAPASVSSGVFTDGGETLLLADPLGKSLLPFSMDGRLQNRIPPLLSRVLKDVPPQVVLQQGERLFVGVPRSRVLMLDKGYSVMTQEAVQVTEVRKKDDELTLQGMFLWRPVGSDFLAFSDVKAANDRWWSALVRFPARDPASFEVLHSVGLLAPSKVFYQLGFPLLASLGDDGYVLLMENPIGIYRSSKGGGGLKQLSAFPEEYDQSPVLPTLAVPDDIVPVMAKIEQSKMPTGLYGWKEGRKGYLYLVVREPDASGTRWTIFKIDPDSDEVVGSARLPTRAHHLTVVPGTKRWAFIEQGRVESWVRQRIDRVVFVPSDRLRGRMPSELCSSKELSN